MNKVIASVAVLVLIGLCTAPVGAQSLQLSPASVEVDVPADGSSQVEFLVYDFAGELEISLENIPLTVEPEKVSVSATTQGSKVVLTLYGDQTLGLETYQGYIRFLARTGGMVAMGIKVRATVNHIVEDKPPPSNDGTHDESPPAIPVPLIIGIAAAVAGAAVLLRRRRTR